MLYRVHRHGWLPQSRLPHHCLQNHPSQPITGLKFVHVRHDHRPYLRHDDDRQHQSRQ